MLIIKLAAFVCILFGGAVCFGQEDIGFLRGDAGRTGVFRNKIVILASSILWKSQPLFKVKDRNDPLLSEVTAFGRQMQHSYGDYWYNPDYRGSFDGNVLLPETSPLFYSGKVFLTLNFESSFMVCLNAADGRELWHFSCKDCQLSTPTTYKNSLLFTATDKKLHVLDADTGMELWSFKPPDDDFLNRLPVVDRGIVFLSGLKGRLYALDIQTRTLKWMFKGKQWLSSPAIDVNNAYVTTAERIYAVDIKTGKEKWSFKGKGRSPVVSQGILYFDDFDGIFALDAATGELKWHQKGPGNVGTLLAVDDTSIYYGGENDQKFYALDKSTGKLRWEIKTKGRSFEPVVSNETVYVGGTREFLVLDAKTGERKDSIDIGPNRASSPALADGFLIVANDDGYLFAIK